MPKSYSEIFTAENWLSNIYASFSYITTSLSTEAYVHLPLKTIQSLIDFHKQKLEKSRKWNEKKKKCANKIQ